MNKVVETLKNNWKISTGILLGLLLVIIITIICAQTNETVRCDNNKAIEQLREQNIASLTQAADDFMVMKKGEDYSIIFSNEVNNSVFAEYARFHYSEEKDSIKANYDKSKALIESVDKDINEVQCTIPVIFKGFSSADKNATLSGIVHYTIHANDRGNVSVTASSLANMFRSNFKPIFSNRQKKYFAFEYKTGSGDTIDAINNLPLEEFGDFFNPLDY